MYSHFIQYTIPRIGQGLVAVILFVNFLFLPFVIIFRGQNTALWLAIPLALTGAVLFLQRDPLGTGMIWTSFLTSMYVVGDLLCLVFWLIGGRALVVWQTVYAGGLLAWACAGALLLYGWRRAHHLYVTQYSLSTPKALPKKTLRIVQLSDVHPGSTMTQKRIPELREKMAALAPDLIVFTGDIFDENTARTDFEAFCSLYAEWQPPLGKWFVYGNHDLGHHWREPQYDRADLERAFAAAHIRILEDVSVLTGKGNTPHPIRLVGRKDWLYTEHHRCSPAELLPGGADELYTLLLDHEPRELLQDAAAGADLILCGHTHGGQIWPVGIISRLFRYNEWNYGLRRLSGGAAVIVSGGTGTWSYQLRTEGRTELVCVDIAQQT